MIYQPTSASAFVTSSNRFHSTQFGGAYDGAGQMTAQFPASQPITQRVDEKWDAAGQRVESAYSLSGVSKTNTMTYDGLGNRVKKNNPAAGNTVYVYDLFGNLAAEYGPAESSNCAPCYLFRDPVGTVRLVVNKNFAVAKRYDTMPFGEQISAGSGWENGRSGAVYTPGSTVKWRFGGGYKDDQTGEWPETVMGARQYSPGYGRFVTPDENLADQGVGDPLSWNLFAYARNNPLRYSDPTRRGCVYVNRGETALQGVDNEVNSGQCGKSGGYWVDGTVTGARFAGAHTLPTLRQIELAVDFGEGEGDV